MTENATISFSRLIDSAKGEKVFGDAFEKPYAHLQPVAASGTNTGSFNLRSSSRTAELAHNFIDHFVRNALSKDPKDKLAQNEERYIFL